MAYGIVTAGQLADTEVVLGTYPMTPASDILHELSKHKNFNIEARAARPRGAAALQELLRGRDAWAVG